MIELTENVNWTAVSVGALIAYLLGWLWYSSKLFATKWMEGNGLYMEEMSGPPVAAMVVQAIGTFLLAWLVGITAAQDALMTIILIVITIVTLLISSGLYVQKKGYVIAIDVGYVVLMAVVMIVCQGLF
jgi:hypothetical protein